ncbi:MAG: FapA family protein [Lachnospiraceae bacterium]|nr:FapA family protein [Lachnospiraceae bacterium]
MYSGPTPYVSISDDKMTATMLAKSPAPGEFLTVDYLKDVLTLNGVKIGFDMDMIESIAGGKHFGEPVVVAKGGIAHNGTDGYYEYFFERELSQKPLISEDGTADYKNIKMVETVEEGQVIATYHPATKGSNGFDLSAKFILASAGKDLPPLRGIGIESVKNDDGTVDYIAKISGKITEVNDRITIKAVHEVNGDLDITQGNINFNGDVIIHGRVCKGMSIVAEGTVTVDGVVESANVFGKKGLILKGGVLGADGGNIATKGDITARFFEYARVEAGGNIFAESFLNSYVQCDGSITLEGKGSVIIGGVIHANLGMKLQTAGNEVGVKTVLTVGMPGSSVAHAEELKGRIQEEQERLQKIEEGLAAIENVLKDNPSDESYIKDKQALSVEHIRSHAMLAGDKDEMARFEMDYMKARNAAVFVTGSIWPGVQIEINGSYIKVKEKKNATEFRYEGGGVKAFNRTITLA